MLIDIPCFPKYKLDTNTMKVISYQKDDEGKYLVQVRMQHAYTHPYQYSMSYNDMYGYTLYNELGKKYFSLTYFYNLAGQHHNKLINNTPRVRVKVNEDSIMKINEYIIGSISKVSGMFSTAATPMIYANVELAKIEAERLAIKDHTKKYVVLKVEGIAKVASTVWE
jgi:hypothetical protein